jgi:hypothetical protein
MLTWTRPNITILKLRLQELLLKKFSQEVLKKFLRSSLKTEHNVDLNKTEQNYSQA